MSESPVRSDIDVAHGAGKGGVRINCGRGRFSGIAATVPYRRSC